MNKLLTITVGILLFLTTSCDSGGNGASIDESDLQGLWALTEWCLEVNSTCAYPDLDELDLGCSTVGVDDIVDEYIFVDDGTTYECDGTGGNNCNYGTYTISGSSFNECDDDPNCEEQQQSSDCYDDYGCHWDYDDGECIWEDGEDGEECTSGTVSLSDDNQTMTLVISMSYEGCQFTQTSTFDRIGDSFEDYENLGD